MNDYLYIAVYGAESGTLEKLLHYKAHLFEEIKNELSIHVSEKPTKVVIDPNHWLLDADEKDNEHSLIQ